MLLWNFLPLPWPRNNYPYSKYEPPMSMGGSENGCFSEKVQSVGEFSGVERRHNLTHHEQGGDCLDMTGLYR